MRKIIYHVATTLDGFIARLDGSTHGFVEQGEHVEDYLQSLKDYDTVIMGKRTYEYGYRYGLEPGQAPYPHMVHYIFSESLSFDKPHSQVKVVNEQQLAFIQDLKETVGSPIYLCGGGEFAGFLLQNQLIDELKIKLNPVLFGQGIHLFGSQSQMPGLQPTCSVHYKNGVSLLTYDVCY